MLGHKMSLNRFKKVESYQISFLTQWIKTRNIEKINRNWHKYREIKHLLEQLTDTRRNHNGNKRIIFTKCMYVCLYILRTVRGKEAP